MSHPRQFSSLELRNLELKLLNLERCLAMLQGVRRLLRHRELRLAKHKAENEGGLSCSM
jgi:hypothetical protein